jgi:hypothetical protein
MRRLLRGVGLVLVGLVVAEGAARLIELIVPRRVVDADYAFYPEHRLFVPADRAGALRTAPNWRRVFFDQTIAVPKPPGTLRLALIGDATFPRVHGELLAMTERFSRQLGQPVDLVDLGGQSCGTARMVGFTRELLDYQPDVAVLYFGNNEYEEVDQLYTVALRPVGRARVLEHSAWYRLGERAFFAARGLVHAREQRELAGTAPDWRRAWDHEYERADIAVRLEAFERNLIDMVELLRGRGVKVLLATSPSNRWRPYLPIGFGKYGDRLRELQERGDYAQADQSARWALRRAAGRHQTSDLENEIVRSVAKTYALPVIEVEEALVKAEPHHIPGETLFDGYSLFNPGGNAVFLNVLETALGRVLGQR